MTNNSKSRRRKIIFSFSELDREDFRFCHRCGERIKNTWDDLGNHFNTHEEVVQH